LLPRKSIAPSNAPTASRCAIAVADDDALTDGALILAECARQFRALAGKMPAAALSLPG
jgi:hypothetical protein